MKAFTVSMMVVTLFTWVTALSAAEKKSKKSSDAKEDTSKSVSWKFTGDLEEACSCAAACPCWFDSKPTKKTCNGFQAVFIKNGTYGKTKLDGLAIANAVQSPEGSSMMESFGDWNFSYLYVDESASPEQRKALEDIGKQVFPIAGSKKVEVRFVPITRKIEGKEHDITLGKYGTVRGHLVEGGLGGGAPKITNPPGADPMHKEYLQGQNVHFTYNDAGMDWKHEGSNYMFAKVSTNNVEYGKFAAAMSQMMEAKNKGKEKGAEEKK